jgi:hypothetical protein
MLSPSSQLLVDNSVSEVSLGGKKQEHHNNNNQQWIEEESSEIGVTEAIKQPLGTVLPKYLNMSNVWTI